MKAQNLVGKSFGKLIVLRRVRNSKYGKTRWRCQCDCGRTVTVIGGNLTSGTSKSCGCSRPVVGLKDLDGHAFGKLTVIRRDGSDKSGRAMWVCQCECGNVVVARSKELLNGDTNSCGCLHSEGLARRNWRGFGEIPMAYWNGVELGAKRRSIELKVTIEDAWKLFLEQNRRCALTGLELSFGRKSKRLGMIEKTASLDRIDSKKPYMLGNLQWVHKNIQRMKSTLSQESFIGFCRLVAKTKPGKE